MGRLGTVEIIKLCTFTPKSITSQNLEGQYVTALFCISSELQLTFSELPKTGGKTGGMGDGTEGHGQALPVLRPCRHEASQAPVAALPRPPCDQPGLQDTRHMLQALDAPITVSGAGMDTAPSIHTLLHRDGPGQLPNTGCPADAQCWAHKCLSRGL